MNLATMRNRWWVDVAQFAIAWPLVIVLMSASMGSGLAWFLLGPKLSKDPSYAFQADLINLDKNPNVPVVVLGDEFFGQSISTTLQGTSIEYAVIDAPKVKLSDLLAPLHELHKSPVQIILIQNSPELWTDVNYKFEQNIALWLYLHRANFHFGKGTESLFWSLLKNWARSPVALWSSGRPVTLRNATPKFPPHRNRGQWKRLRKIQKKGGAKLIWVSDISHLTTDVDDEQTLGTVNHILSEEYSITGMQFANLDDVLPLVEKILDR